MKDELKYGTVLGLLLSITAAIGNALRSDPHTIHVLPWTIELLYFPLVLYPALMRVTASRPSATFTLAGSVRIGVAISLYASILFGFVMLALSYYFLPRFPLTESVKVMMMTIVATLLLGCLTSVICCVILRKRQPA